MQSSTYFIFLSVCTQGIFLVLSVISIYRIETNLHKWFTIEKSGLKYGNNI